MSRTRIGVWKICMLALTVCFPMEALAQAIAVETGFGVGLFKEHIRSVFETQCQTCHNSELKQGGLDLSTRALLLRGGDRGPAIVPGDPKSSLLYRLVAQEEEPRMPFKGKKLPDDVIARIADWIRAGAPFDEPSLGTTSTNDKEVSSTGVPRRVVVQTSGDTTGGKSAVEQAHLVLEKQCLMCHGGKWKKNGLDLSTRDALLRGGDSGSAVVLGNAKASLLYKKVSHENEPGMPYKGNKLPEDQIARLAEWINAGAPYDRALALSPSIEASSPDEIKHWAYQSPKRSAVPKVRNVAWVRNPIDAFISADHEKRGLKPLSPAEKNILLRRVYLDLIGLPPSTEQLDAFLADRSKDAYERVVDSLLASPQYGERWGRHWMDVWRYSDWYGFGSEVRFSQRFIWHWRDWIIESLNKDKGYDQMIVEMLAGDELSPTDPKVVRATGFVARNYDKYDRHKWMQDAVDHTAMGFLGITIKCARCHDHKYDPITQEEYYRFRAFFEPYDVRTDRVPGQPDLSKDGLPRVFDAEVGASTYRLKRGDPQNPDTEHSLSPGVPEILSGKGIDIQPVALTLDTFYPDFRHFVRSDLVSQVKTEIDKAEAELAEAQKRVREAQQQMAGVGIEKKVTETSIADGSDPAADSTKPVSPDVKEQKISKVTAEVILAEKRLAAARAALPAIQARIEAEVAKYDAPPNANEETLTLAARKAERQAGLLKAEENLLRAQQQLADAMSLPLADQKAAADKKAADQKTSEEKEKKAGEARKQVEAALAALSQPIEGYTPLGKVYPRSSTGRRLALARWIASKQNPLTARVAINHIWLRHFGRPLVPTVFDFGLNGKPPTHPELLDWLAIELIEKDWSMKTVHRLVVTSNTYRMQSSADEPVGRNLTIDPDNQYLWRMNARRMEAEIVRDSVLFVGGKLDTMMGGPDLDESQGLTSPRRSIYFRHNPELQMEFLKLFDSANPDDCYERNESVTPQQALAMANSRLTLSQARLVARRLSEKAGSDPRSFVGAAFKTVLGRPPSVPERVRGETFLRQQGDMLRNSEKLTKFHAGSPNEVQPAVEPHLRARENLVHVLFNHNEFVTIR